MRRICKVADRNLACIADYAMQACTGKIAETGLMMAGPFFVSLSIRDTKFCLSFFGILSLSFLGIFSEGAGGCNHRAA